MHWEGEKKRRLKRLREAIERGEVDEPVIPVLDAINRHPDWCTTSSCSGRVIVLHEPEIGDKTRSRFLARWHRPPEPHEIAEAVEKAPPHGITWVKAQPPLIHVMCKGLDAALELRAVATRAGFKATSIRSIKGPKTVVEIIGGERMDVPAIVEGEPCLTPDAWEPIAELASRLLERGHERLERLLEEVERTLEG
ncbi:MAG: hypothetical protein GXO28_04780 [Methanopyri archaeon]|nr:hypothetical protein [Methanopyri archaeon]